MNENEKRELETLETVTKQMAVAATRCSRDFRYLWANQAYADWIHRPLNEIVDRPIMEVLGQAAFDALLPRFHQVLAGETVRYEQETNFRGIGPRWISAAYIPTPDANGVPDGWVAIVIDVTERKRADEAVKESEQRFRLVADTTPVLIWMSGRDKLCTYFNKSWLDFTGRSMESELGNGWAEGVHSEDLQRCLDTYTRAFDRREGFRMEYRLRRHDGEYRWISDIGAPRFGQDGSFIGYIGSCIDVTEQKRAEDTLRKSEERFRLAAQAGKMYAYEWDVTTDILVRSSESENVLGLTEPKRFTRQQFMDRIHPDDHAKFVAAIARLAPDDPTSEVTYRFVLPDGALIWLKNRGRAFFDSGGRMLRVIGMVADVSDYKRAEEAVADMTRKLVEAQEQERARIARELHDDITQRLALLAIGLDQFAEKHSDLPSEARGRMQELQQMTSDISADVHALSHELHSSALEYLGIVTGMRSWCKEFGERHKLEIAFEGHEVPAAPQEISLCLFRVLQEALQNAVKHSGTKRLEVRLEEKAGGIHLIVSDAGAGFDLEAARQSRGLGLKSMQERIRLVGGTIAIDSKPLAGTTIHVTAPLGSASDYQRQANHAEREKWKSVSAAG
jgi:PAS domain S-box-containing protein